MFNCKHEGTNSLSKQNHVCAMDIAGNDDIRFKPGALASDTQENRSCPIEERLVDEITLAPNSCDLCVEVVEQLRREPTSDI